jgi:hypothetical protein
MKRYVILAQSLKDEHVIVLETDGTSSDAPMAEVKLPRKDMRVSA